LLDPVKPYDLTDGFRLLRPSIWTQNRVMESDPNLTATEQRPAERSVRGRPFPPGVSGNPGGRVNLQQRTAELYAIMAADLGGSFSGMDELLLVQACRMLARSEKTADPEIAVKCSNAGTRLLSILRKKRPRAGRPMREQLTAESVDA
jgi:hypothetical protein